MDPYARAFMTLKELSGKTKIHYATLRAWCISKKIPAVKIGARFFVRISDSEKLTAICERHRELSEFKKPQNIRFYLEEPKCATRDFVSAEKE